jgi:hypothetical protein
VNCFCLKFGVSEAAMINDVNVGHIISSFYATTS